MDSRELNEHRRSGWYGTVRYIRVKGQMLNVFPRDYEGKKKRVNALVIMRHVSRNACGFHYRNKL